MNFLAKLFLRSDNMELKFTEKELKDIMWSDSDHELVYEGDWEDQGKYQISEVVFRHAEDGKFYMFAPVRTGNHYSGYELEFWDTDVWEVEQKEIVVTKWVEVNG
jgi:hypothetical protein